MPGGGLPGLLYRLPLQGRRATHPVRVSARALIFGTAAVRGGPSYPLPHLFIFTDFSAGPHMTGTTVALQRVDAPTVVNYAEGWFAPGLEESRMHASIRRANCRIGPRPKADGRDVAMKMNQCAGRRTPGLPLHPQDINRQAVNRQSGTQVRLRAF